MTKTPCQLDPDAFSTIAPRGPTFAGIAELERRIRHAKTLCAGCHRLDACREDLASVPYTTIRQAGMVWAGRTPKEELDRRAAERKAARKATK